MASTDETARRVAAAKASVYRPRSDRPEPSPTREIKCRTCGRWTTVDPTPPGEPTVWTRHHTDDGTPSCTPFALTQGEPE